MSAAFQQLTCGRDFSHAKGNGTVLQNPLESYGNNKCSTVNIWLLSSLPTSDVRIKSTYKGIIRVPRFHCDLLLLRVL